MTSTRPHRLIAPSSRKALRFGYALALAALVAQVSLPWVKGWHVEPEHLDSIATLASRASSGPEVASDDRATAHHQHDDATCPVCRLIGQSHGALLVAALRVTAAPLVTHAIPPHTGGIPPTLFIESIAPRGPPFPLA